MTVEDTEGPGVGRTWRTPAGQLRRVAAGPLLLALVTLTLAGCAFLGSKRADYQTGSATVVLTSSEIEGPQGPLALESGGWVEGSGQPSIEGGNATFSSPDGWTLVMTGVAVPGRAGAVTLMLGEEEAWSWMASGNCEFTLEPGTPGLFAGTARCPRLTVIRGTPESVALSIDFVAAR